MVRGCSRGYTYRRDWNLALLFRPFRASRFQKLRLNVAR